MVPAVEDQALFCTGANVNLEDKDFITPLMVAASDGLLDVVKTLLAAGEMDSRL